MDNNDNNVFSYTYSAKEQDEIKRIREKYAMQLEVEDKMTRLRRLDASVTHTAMTVALIVGIFGTLPLGSGMSLIMTDLRCFFNIGKIMSMVIGIAVGLSGGIIASLAYPIYHALVKSKRKKLSPEIIRLTDELIK